MVLFVAQLRTKDFVIMSGEETVYSYSALAFPLARACMPSGNDQTWDCEQMQMEKPKSVQTFA